jgi:hypothetical protein
MIQQHQHHAAVAVVSSNRGKVTHHMPHTFATAASTPINSSSAMATTLACTPTSSSGIGAGAASADALLRGVGNEDDVLFRWLSKVIDHSTALYAVALFATFVLRIDLALA